MVVKNIGKPGKNIKNCKRKRKVTIKSRCETKLKKKEKEKTQKLKRREKPEKILNKKTQIKKNQNFY